MKPLAIVFIFVLSLHPLAEARFSKARFSEARLSKARLCKSWSSSKSSYKLDVKLLPEASGISKSHLIADRLYHINDSGDGPHFYVTNLKGRGMKKVTVNVALFQDTEDLSVAPCGAKSCLFIGDIGDNSKSRSEIQIYMIEEREVYPSRVHYKKILRLRYPDRPHNAEAFAIHPNGDLFIFTKEYDFNKKEAYSFFIFKLSKTQMASRGLQTLEFVTRVDLPSLFEKEDFMGQMVTSMDISKDGKRVVFLTYLNAVEVQMDLSQKKTFKKVKDWVRGKDFQVIKTEELPQQEALTFSKDGNSLYYNTEYHESDVYLHRLNCKD